MGSALALNTWAEPACKRPGAQFSAAAPTVNFFKNDLLAVIKDEYGENFERIKVISLVYIQFQNYKTYSSVLNGN
jgi:hypothetical protein